MRKCCDGEKKSEKKGNGKKIITFIVATNIVNSRPAERRPTETPQGRANMLLETLQCIPQHMPE